jgi:outer membrane receptor protein involved in Fe transport
MLVATACSSVAVAQTGTAATEPAVAAPTEQPKAAPSEPPLQQVMVTGSRIVRQDYQSNSPIVTLSEDLLKAAGPSTIESVLNNLPQFAAIRPGSTLSAGRGGRNSANLRGLGIGRTLVLLDGRRLQPSDLLGTVDLNTIPQPLIDNVEVITGGASAAYGSDAIAGVVNFKLKRFTGVQVDAQYATSEHRDAGASDLSVAWGQDFADQRGHIQAGVSYLKRDLTPRGARPFFINKLPSTLLAGGIFQADSNNLPSQAGINAVFARYGVTGNVPRNASLGVNPDGTLFTGAATATVPVLNLRWNDPPYFVADGTRVAQHVGESLPLQQGMEKINFFSNGTLELNKWATAYQQISFVHYSSQHTSSTQGFREPVIPITNPFIPADLKAVLASRPKPDAPLIYYWGSGKVAPLQITTDYHDVAQAVFGLKGKVPDFRDWTWDVYANFGRATDQTHATTNILRSAVISLLNAPDGGRSICPGGFNPFTPDPLVSGPSTSACAAYVNRPTDRNANFSQKIFEGSLQGTLFKLPAGDLKFAAGANYRQNSFSDNPAALAVEGALLLTVPGQFQNRAGMDRVSEVFGELVIPVLRDKPLIKDLTLNLAGRNSDYRSIGKVTTYQASGDWQIVKPVRLRGGYQRAIRAPNLDELFPTTGIGAAQVGQTAQGGGDPCDINSPFRRGASDAQVRALCLATGIPGSVIDLFQFPGNSVNTMTPPGANLKQETADTANFGVVFKSTSDQPFLRNLQLSVDYYRIKLKDAIGTITAPVTLNLCFNSNGASNPGYSAENMFCRQIQRDAGGAITQVLTPRLNLAAYESSGIDTQLDWRVPLYDWGSLALNTVLSYQRHYTIQNFKGDPVVEYTGTIGNGQIDPFSISHPKWKVQASATWRFHDVSTTLLARALPAMFDSQDASGSTRSRPGVGRKYYYDATVNWSVNENLSVRAGVLNLTNTQPPYFATAPEATDTALYDIVGRRFYVGLSNLF